MCWKTPWILGSLAWCLGLMGADLPATPSTLPADPAAAWKLIRNASNPPLPPADWNRRTPSKEEVAGFRLHMATNAARAADLAQEFATRFPKDPHAEEATTLRLEMLGHAVDLGLTARTEEYKKLRAADASSALPEGDLATHDPKDPLEQRLAAAVAAARKHQSEGQAAMIAEYLSQLRGIQKDYPKRPEVYGALLQVSQQLKPDAAEAILKEIEGAAEAGSIPSEFKRAVAQIRKSVEAVRKQNERVGKPLPLQFKAVDNREVNLAALKGKVVLVDFWATWCGPCVAELPHVKEAYERFHPQGFEIVGISLDEDRNALLRFTQEQKMPWPQFFDGKGWENRFAQEFGIAAIPAMWLVDPEGRLVDLEAGDDLAGKVERLLKSKSN